ncbi:flagellar biosynthesis protein FlhG [Metabacillus crassostreae]|uniref:MinD/ParA family protein n=1 Tax=Metabacillus crassostreae TaxID=929098 RepID=UPI00195E61DC|nr:MinD/ParA family protein [Metabacillus crassostreae]MBM7603304.1 flagellar biosynthesis protein FlhG [Metabacillus crassostreae]
MANDQAERLRERLKSLKLRAKSIAVMSGKGGVGKSNFSLNFSLALQKENKRVLLFDLDIGMGNIDILIGESSNHSIVDFFRGNLSLVDIISHGPNGLDYISGGTGLGDIFKMNEERFHLFLNELDYLFKAYDFIIFDMGAGISEDSLRFILSVDEIIVITTPEPTSMTDAYSAIKNICVNHQTMPFSIVVNRAFNNKVGDQTFQRLFQTMKQFLNREITLLGVIPDDSSIMKAVIDQQPVLLYQPSCKASKALLSISKDFLTRSHKDEEIPESTPFISKLKSFFMKGRQI